MHIWQPLRLAPALFVFYSTMLWHFKLKTMDTDLVHEVSRDYANMAASMMLPRGSVDGSRNAKHLKMPRNMHFYSTWSVNEWDLWEGHGGKPGREATGFYCCGRSSKF